MTVGLGHYLALASLLFAIGAAGFLTRRTMLFQLMSIEIMLNAVNVTLVAFNRWQTTDHGGQLFAFFVIAVAAAEAGVGLAILISLFRLTKSVRTDNINTLKH